MSEQVYVVYVVSAADQEEQDNPGIIGVARTPDTAQAIALEYFDSEDARVDTGDPMHIFGGWADAYIEVHDLVG